MADRVERLLQGEKPEQSAVEQAPSPQKSERGAARNEALTLLAALQREARFLDFVQEPLDGYGDAQVGAAAREVHRECGKVLDRMFAPQPVRSEEEGADIELPADFDAGRYRLTGDLGEQAPRRGRLVHHGWEATACELPVWSGSEESARVIAPAEIEVKSG